MRSSPSFLRQLKRVPGGLRRRLWRCKVATLIDRAGVLGHGEAPAEAQRLAADLGLLADLRARGVLSSTVSGDEAHRIAALTRFAADLEVHGLMGPLSEGIERWAPFLRFAPPGHFYSPIPDLTEIDRRSAQIFDKDRAGLPGIDLREQAQLEVFGTLAGLVADVELPRAATEGWRYHTDNVAFGMGDALVLHAFLRHVQPRRLIEIGSGWSSALILDTADRYLPDLRCTFIDPYPELVRSLLARDDQSRATVVPEPVQTVDPSLFAELGDGDVLFVDLSHVAKVGSDTTHVYLEILPTLAPGVVVHFHDIFWPFEYDRSWVDEGRAWTEAYLLRALLCENPSWELLLWNDWLACRHRDVIVERLPRMLENTGGSIWLRRTR